LSKNPKSKHWTWRYLSIQTLEMNLVSAEKLFGQKNPQILDKILDEKLFGQKNPQILDKVPSKSNSHGR
jgi:hypothetical protein